jgi:hypothetical protein
VSSPKAKDQAEQVEDRIIRQSDDDRTMALARTRIDIERALRDLIGKDTDLPISNPDVKYMSVSRLFDKAAAEYSPLRNLQQPFRYMMQICNAAIHAQRVSEDQANEALALGAQILALIQSLENGDLLP